MHLIFLTGRENYRFLWFDKRTKCSSNYFTLPKLSNSRASGKTWQKSTKWANTSECILPSTSYLSLNLILGSISLSMTQLSESEEPFPELMLLLSPISSSLLSETTTTTYSSFSSYSFDTSIVKRGPLYSSTKKLVRGKTWLAIICASEWTNDGGWWFYG